MKKVITMVGTSIFENYFEEESEDKISRGYFEDLQEKRAKEFDLEKGKIQSLRDAIKEWIGSRKDKGREVIFSFPFNHLKYLWRSPSV